MENKLSIIKKFFISLLIILILIISVCAYELKMFSSTPASYHKAKEITFVVNSGSSFSNIAKKLREKGLISNILKFKLYSRLKKLDNKIHAGEYILSQSMTPEKILLKFTTGEVNLIKVVVPEGYTIRQTGEKLHKLGICKIKDFIKASRDKNLLSKFDIPADNFEGYLFPETYFFQKNTKPEKIIQKMVMKFFAEYNDSLREKAKKTGMTDFQVIILASIIEKETGKAEERKIISSVFHNRLKKNMKLETDPTVIYGIKDFNGNITRKDLERKTPYNTYIIKGLPKGPISNPGLDSIKAALYPAKTKYLFFVSKNNGSHYFSKKYSEHLKAVRKYQLGK